MKKLTLGISFLLLSVTQVFAGDCLSLTANLVPGSSVGEILSLQNFLVKKGLLTATPNGYFGEGTKRAVMAYQDSIGLPDNGTVYASTREAINQESCTGIIPVVTTTEQAVQTVKVVQPASCVDLPRNIFRGEETSDVRKLQNFLYKKGLLTAVPNGYYGVGTTAAVKDYQRSKDLKQTGDTLNMMREEIKNETCLSENQSVAVSSSNNFPEGCSSSAGFSTVTGVSCSSPSTLPDGCMSVNGFSITTGLSCSSKGTVTIAQPAVTPVVTSPSPVAPAGEVYTSLSLQLTPNSPGLPFIQNSTHVKLATIAIHSPNTLTISALMLMVATTSVPTNTISNFTLTDVGQDKVINGGPLFAFTNQAVVANQAKIFELYADIGALGQGVTGFTDFNGVVTLKDNGLTITNVVIPTFSVLTANK